MPFRYDAVELFDLGYGSRIISVTPPDCTLAPGTKILPKDRGKAPGYLAQDGWTGASVNDPRHRCHDWATAKNWRDNWGANTGLVAGQGLVIVDNDQGETFSQFLRALFPRAPRRFVMDPKHLRDAFLVRVVDGDSMEPEDVANVDLKFRNGLITAKIQILAKGKQAVIGGVHPDTRMPYAWDRELPPLDEIPAITLSQFGAALDAFADTIAQHGWDRQTRKSVSAPVSVIIGGTTSPLHHKNSYGGALTAGFALLAEIPNRDVEPSKANAIDKWLDDAQNWLSVGYAFAAFIASYRFTPEARDGWCIWSDGRFQQDWPSDKVWASIVKADLRYGETALVEIVRQFKRAPIDFPDLDPDEFPADPPKDPPKATPIWDAMRARWAYSKRKGFIDMQTGSVCDATSFSTGEARRGKALCKELGIKGKTVSAAVAFSRQPDMIEVFDLTYAPGDGPFVASKDPGMPSFNRWKATTILAEPVAKSHIQKWLDHLSFVLGSDAERDRFLRWCAYVAQYPEYKPNWHFLVLSVAGMGKDTMTLPLKLAVGKENHIDITSNALDEQFNPWAERKLVIIGEFNKSTRNGGEVANRLKPLLAAPPDELTINRKNMQQYEIPNRTAVVMFSNAQNPLYLERGSRRVHVVNRLDQDRRDDAYYLDMFKWLNDGGAALCAAYILTLPLSDAEKAEFKGVAPATDAKVELEEQNVEPGLAALEELIADARKGMTADTPHTLVASADELAGMIGAKPGFKNRAPSGLAVSAWLRAMHGVHRLRTDPKHPNRCGVVSAVINGVTISGRLWGLSEATTDGRLWSTLSDAEIVSIWKNLSPPKSGVVIPFTPKAGGGFPDEPI